MFSQLDKIIRGVIDGEKYLLDFLIDKLKEKSLKEEMLDDKVDQLTRKVYDKCANCAEGLEKKNI